jgi:hypothetical protein
MIKSFEAKYSFFLSLNSARGVERWGGGAEEVRNACNVLYERAITSHTNKQQILANFLISLAYIKNAPIEQKKVGQRLKGKNVSTSKGNKGKI